MIINRIYALTKKEMGIEEMFRDKKGRNNLERTKI